MGMLMEKQSCFQLAGRLQQKLLNESPYGKATRFVDAQWVWALGHIGLLHQIMRFLAVSQPETLVILHANGSANPYFLQTLLDHFHTLKVATELPVVSHHIAMTNAIFFGCPDGNSSLVDYYKKLERICKGKHLLELNAKQTVRMEQIKREMGLERQGILAIQPRNLQHEPERNADLEALQEEISKHPALQPVITGMDPCTLDYPSVQTLENPLEASFLLSASCEHFIGSNSGAWVIPHGFGREVTLVNDHLKAAWCYE